MPRVVLGIGITGWLAIALAVWAMAPLLGHDEAQYAIAARDLVDGRPERWINVSPGTALLAVPGVLAGGDERALRALPLLLGVVFVITGVMLARSVRLDHAAAWLACVMASSLGIVKRSADLLSDMPAAAGLLAGAAVLVGELTHGVAADSDRPRRRVLLAAPAFAAAFYVRYGSAIPITIIGLVAAIAGWRAIRRRPWPVIATVALFVALLAPHFITATIETGSPLGVILTNASLTSEAKVEPGLATYVTSNPLAWYGLALAPLLVIGLGAIARLRDRWIIALWSMAMANVIALGITAIAQPRYIYFSLVVFGLLGIEVVRRYIVAQPPSRRRWCVAGACAWLVASWIAAFVSTMSKACARPSSEIRTAARVIRDDTGRIPCRVLGARTELGWYSPCDLVPAMDYETVVRWRHYVVELPPHGRALLPNAIYGTPHPIYESATLEVLRVDP